MDLLQSVRKEGSRGGVDFKWDDVKNSNHRENYLGHSLMAPVGRWQKGRDLNWYANGTDDAQTNEEEEAQRRKDELRKVKEAEEDAMARALGLPVPDRSANTEPLGERPTLEASNKATREMLEIRGTDIAGIIGTILESDGGDGPDHTPQDQSTEIMMSDHESVMCIRDQDRLADMDHGPETKQRGDSRANVTALSDGAATTAGETEH